MQKLQLFIPEPCHENWHNMTPTNQGRFCNACAKEVVDFSMMTDTEVLNYFTTLTHEKVCGRALPSQLERTITWPKDPKKRLFWYWNYIVMFFMFFGKGNAAKAQGGIKPVTEFSPVKANDIKRDIAVVVDDVRKGSRVITGKVIDIDGLPVPYASIKIKGAHTGISADANGVYSIRVKDNTILITSGASFKTSEVPVGLQSTVNTVLEKIIGGDLKEVVVTAVLGGMRRRDMDEDYVYPDKIKNIATINVKDEATGKVLQNATIEISTYEEVNTAYTDKKGMYKMKRMKGYENYFIKVMADGYEPSEFEIDANDFKDRKKEWEVLLKKQKSAFGTRTKMAAQNIKGDMEVRIVGQTFVSPLNTDSLYIIDGVSTTKAKADNLNPDDISDITRLGKSESVALFGIDGSNGAIVITTRRAKEISMKEVVLTSGTLLGGIRNVTTTETTIIEKCEILVDTVKTFVANLTGAIKIYPNPVQRGNEINISLKLKQTGLHQIQITDAAGQIVLQKQINAMAKEFTEKMLVDNRWSSGVYYISIIDNKNQLINKKSFIVR